MKEHIFFDLDHTLWDFEKNSALTFQEILTSSNILIDIDDFLQTYVPINLKYWKRYREEKILKKELKYIRLKETFDQLQYSVDDQTIDYLSDQYILKLPDYNHLFEGTIEILEYLKDQYKLHIITNGFEEVQNKKMRKSGILHFFDHIITSESVGVKKPNPKVFKHALDMAKTSASSSVMIGDNLEADIEGALAAGMHAIHFMPLEKKHPSHYIEIDKLQELKFLL